MKSKTILRKNINKIDKSLVSLTKKKKEYIISNIRNKRKISTDVPTLKNNKEIL